MLHCSIFLKMHHQGLKISIFIIQPNKPTVIDCENYKASCHKNKILLKIIQRRIQTKIDNELAEEQSRFYESSIVREVFVSGH